MKNQAEGMEILPQNEKIIDDGHLNEKEAQDVANMMRGFIESYHGHHSQYNELDIKPKDYDEAFGVVQEVIDLAKKEPNMEKFKNDVLRAIQDVSFLPVALIAAILDTLDRLADPIRRLAGKSVYRTPIGVAGMDTSALEIWADISTEIRDKLYDANTDLVDFVRRGKKFGKEESKKFVIKKQKSNAKS